jgi:hypothetical protein
VNVTQKASKAAKVFLTLQNLTTVANFYAERENPSDADGNQVVREIPCVRCFCSQPEEYPPLSGNYKLNLHVLVEASEDDTSDDDFYTMTNEVFAKVHTSSIHTDLSDSLDDFTCFGIAGAVSQSPSVDFQKRLRRQELVVPIYACASDIDA